MQYKCTRCGIVQSPSVGDTCPTRVHSGTVVTIQNQFYQTGNSGGYYQDVQQWSCCGILSAPPCTTTQIAHDYHAIKDSGLIYLNNVGYNLNNNKKGCAQQ